MARTATARVRKGPQGIPGPREIRTIVEKIVGPRSIIEAPVRPVPVPMDEEREQQRRAELQAQIQKLRQTDPDWASVPAS